MFHLEKNTIKNKNYRKVIQTTSNLQLVLMSIPINEEIGFEKHKKTTQFIRIERGEAKVYLKDKSYKLKSGDSIIIPPKIRHNVVNIGKRSLKLYTIYSRPEHTKSCKQKNKRDKEC